MTAPSPPRRPPLLVALVALTWMAAGCSDDGGDDKPDTGFSLPDVGDSGIFNPTDTQIGLDIPPEPDVPDAGEDTGPDIDVADPAQSVALALTVDALKIGERSALTGSATLQSGAELTDLQDDDHEVRWLVDDVDIGAGPNVVADGPQPGVSVWRDPSDGSWFAVGVRPGTWQLVLEVDLVKSAAVTVQVSYPTQPGIHLGMVDAAGSTPAKRATDTNEVIKLEGQTPGSGGLTATIRFPAATEPGGKAPVQNDANTTMNFTVPDLAGLAISVAEGAVWIDQVDNGLFRGSFLGKTTSLKPVAGAFVVERIGDFGIDLLGETQVLLTSSSVLPQTGDHHSRPIIVPGPGGDAVLMWRKIVNKAQVFLERGTIDPQTGTLTQDLPALGWQAQTLEETDGGGLSTEGEGIGHADMVQSGDTWMLVWDGRAASGKSAPYGVWMQPLDGSLAPVDAPIAVTDDSCVSECRPQVIALPANRFLIAWTAPDGGVRARRVTQLLQFEDTQTLELTPPGRLDISAAAHDGSVVLGWRNSTADLPGAGANYRHYTDTVGGGLAGALPAALLGTGGLAARAPVMRAVTLPTQAPNRFFFAAWRDIDAGKTVVRYRKLTFDGKLMGPAPTTLFDGAPDQLTTAAGRDGQVLFVDAQGANSPTLTARKVKVPSFQLQGQPLGDPVVLASDAPHAMELDVVYLPGSNVYIAVWGGDLDSEQIALRRFR